ncbi:MAG: hypothetical protein ACREQY_03645 [Candidatus Binatia bacterium]
MERATRARGRENEPPGADLSDPRDRPLVAKLLIECWPKHGNSPKHGKGMSEDLWAKLHPDLWTRLLEIAPKQKDA